MTHTDVQERAGEALGSFHDASAQLVFDSDRAPERSGGVGRRVLRGFVLIAAVVAVASVPWLYLEYRYWDHVSAPAGAASATVVLPDRTTVELQPGAEIKYLKNMRSGRGHYRRDVYLSGGATFASTADAAVQFVVNTENARIVAVGEARFRVVERESVTEVYVYEGRVTTQARDEYGELVPGVTVINGGDGGVAGQQAP